MSKLLILGVSPLPFESTNQSFGPGTRTWQLTEPLLDEGHSIHLVGYRIPGTYPEDAPPEQTVERGDLTYTSLEGPRYHETSFIQDLHDRFQPDAVIFAHASASFAPGILTTNLPTWIDLCGHVMAEAQAKAAVYEDDSYIDHFFSRVVGLLSRGDVFSAVSDAQVFAVIGELGLLGRLNAANDGHNMVHSIPCGVEEESYVHEFEAFRGIDVPEDAFVVLWSGGFNTWTDVDTLFGGLIHAMDKDPGIYFVATGGQIDGHDELTYPRFERLVSNCALAGRFVLKGWIPREQVPSHYFEADVGINCEKDIYEVRLGSKHRILDWSRAALPVVSTRVTEISAFIEREELGFVCDPGSSEALGDAILEAVRAKEELPALGECFEERAREVYGFKESTRELRKWAHDPTPSRDRSREARGVERMLELQAEREAQVRKIEAELSPKADESREPIPEIELDLASESETRLGWFRRVIGNSMRQGGFRLVLKRLWARLLGNSSALGD